MGINWTWVWQIQMQTAITMDGLSLTSSMNDYDVIYLAYNIML